MPRNSENAARLRGFIEQFYKPNTRVTMWSAEMLAMTGGTILSLFTRGKKGIPRVPTLKKLAQATRQRLVEKGAEEIARQSTVIGWISAAGYVDDGDVQEYLEVEGNRLGWMKEADCLGRRLDHLSPENRLVIEEMIQFLTQKEEKEAQEEEER